MRIRIRHVALAGGGALLVFAAWLFAVWPPPFWYRTHWPRETAFMAMRGDDARRRYEPVPLDRIARQLREAAVIGEDARFWTHRGIDGVELLRALGYRRASFSWSSARDRAELRRSLARAWERRDRLRGASTITQQLAKNLYLSPSRNPLRKVKEAVTAWRLERALGKERILELYLNVAEFGPGIWGAEAASRRYYGIPASRLNRAQAAALAATLPFPLRSNPEYRPGRMQRRQLLILRRMRGERVEVPPVADEPEPPPPVDVVPPDTIAPTPGLDSLLDSLRAPIETVPPPMPLESLPSPEQP